MQAALDYFATPNTTPLYSEIFFNRQYRFQYPPSALFTLQGLQWLAPGNVRTDETQIFPGRHSQRPRSAGSSFWRPAWPRRRCSSCRSASDTPSDSRVLVAARVAIVAGFTLTFYPIVKAYTLGQLQVWINGLFAVALLCWAVGWKSVSGFLVGLTCLMKPHYGLFLPWALLRGGMALPGRVRGHGRGRTRRFGAGVRARQPHRLPARGLVPRRARRGLLPESLDQRPAQPHHGHRRSRAIQEPRVHRRPVPAVQSVGLRHHPDKLDRDPCRPRSCIGAQPAIPSACTTSA